MERVLLRFLRFSLEQDATFMTNRNGVWRQSNRTCMFDVVEVFDGGDSSAPLMARLCGSVRPPEMISSGRFMRVRFRSDVSVARQGFTAQYVSGISTYAHLLIICHFFTDCTMRWGVRCKEHTGHHRIT